MTKTQAISAAILAKVAAGMTVQQAINSVLGEGRFEALVDDLYERLRNKAAA